MKLVFFRARLRELFSQIEKEFESLYSENAQCKYLCPVSCLSSACFDNLIIFFLWTVQEKVDSLNERLEREAASYEKTGTDCPDFDHVTKSASKHKSKLLVDNLTTTVANIA